MKAMKIRITDKEHSRQVQEALFAAGYGWNSHRKDILHTDAKFLFACCFGGNEITYEWDDEKYFLDHKAAEHFLHAGQFVTEPPPKQPAKPALENISKPVLEDIFIKLDSITTKEVARKALEDAGYHADAGWEQAYWNNSHAHLVGNSNGCIGAGTDSTYLKDRYQERFVWQGKLVEGAYFTAPETTTVKVGSLSSLGSGGELTCTGALNGVFGNFTVDGEGSISRPPLGLKPRKIHDQDRLIEILQACLRYADAGKQVPSEWWAEAQYLNNLMEAK